MRALRLSVVVALAGAACGSALADGLLREGEHGFYCATHDGTDRLWKTNDFYFCSRDDRLSNTVAFAVLGDPDKALVDAIARFGRVLKEKAGVTVRASPRPQVLFIMPRSGLPLKTRQERAAAFAAALAKAKIELPSAALQRLDVDLTVGPEALAQTDRLSVGGQTMLVVQTFDPNHPVPSYAHVVSDAITGFLGLQAPMVAPERKVTTSDGGVVYDARREIAIRLTVAKQSQSSILAG